MLKQILYTGCALDRAAHLRRDDGWLAERLCAPETRFVPVWRDLSLVVPGRAPAAAVISGNHGLELGAGAEALVLLGIEDGGRAWFAADLSERDEGVVAGLCGGAEFTELRRVGALMQQAHVDDPNWPIQETPKKKKKAKNE